MWGLLQILIIIIRFRTPYVVVEMPVMTLAIIPHLSYLWTALCRKKKQACFFLDIIFPPILPSIYLSSSRHCALQDGFCQWWWSRHMSVYHFPFTMSRKPSCDPKAAVLLFPISSHVMRFLYEMFIILRSHFFSRVSSHLCEFSTLTADPLGRIGIFSI